MINLFRKLRCIIFGHRLTLSVEYSPWFLKYYCKKCKRFFCMQLDARYFGEWDIEDDAIVKHNYSNKEEE
jgi:hypothetical protein